MQIEVFTQSSIKLSGNKIIYFDPFKIDKNYYDADYIFITHNHYDHYDEASIKKIMKDDTKIIAPRILAENIQKITSNNIIVEPNENHELEDLTFKTTPAYNLNKDFHPKSANYVGYLITISNTTYYIMGDTDAIEENKDIVTDICFIPIGGKYTMDVQEAANYINELKPKIAIPIHYGSIVGDISLGEEFKKLVNNEIKVDIYIEEDKI